MALTERGGSAALGNERTPSHPRTEESEFAFSDLYYKQAIEAIRVVEASPDFRQLLAASLIMPDLLTTSSRGLFRSLEALCLMALRRAWASLCANSANVSPEGRYQRFLNDLRGGLMGADGIWPLLSAAITREISYWGVAIAIMLKRYLDDHYEIRTLLLRSEGPITLRMFVSHKSDFHNNNQSVAIVSFKCGKNIVYKPRTVAAEEGIRSIIEFMKIQGAPITSTYCRTIVKNGYGWCEYFSSHDGNNGNASIFYQQTGSLLCLSWLFGITDIHNENILACGDHPVIVDIECLFQPKNKRVNLSAEILRTGLVRLHQRTPNGDLEDLSGIAVRRTSFTKHRRIVLYQNTDCMCIVSKKYIGPNKLVNVFRYEGIYSFGEEHISDIIFGFNIMMEFLRKFVLDTNNIAAVKGEFERCPMRVILRPTMEYLKLIREDIEYYDPVLSRSGRNERHYGIAALEYEDIRNRDVPIFYTYLSSKGLFWHGAEVCDRYFIESGWDGFMSRVGVISDRYGDQLSRAVNEIFIQYGV